MTPRAGVCYPKVCRVWPHWWLIDLNIYTPKVYIQVLSAYDVLILNTTVKIQNSMIRKKLIYFIININKEIDKHSCTCNNRSFE